ncbi:uncharacterized protein LOC118438035 isoform X1 [Folsomia candida]|nr:uncharacterized protein LOC118438035 isoform X1 [Folsomia candida]
MNDVLTRTDSGMTILIWRCSHVLCDGLSVLKMATKLFDSEVPNVLRHQRSLDRSRIISMCKSPYNFLLQNAALESNDTQIPRPIREDFTPQGNLVTKTSVPIAMTFLKRIKDAYRVDIQTILLAGVASAIRNHYREIGHPIDSDVKTGFILPQSATHPGGLVNNVRSPTILLPIGENDSVRRLQLIAVRVKMSHSPYVQLIGQCLNQLVATLPLRLGRSVVEKMHTLRPVVVNNIVGPPNKLYLFGHQVSIIHAGVNIKAAENRGFAFYFCFYTYQDIGNLEVRGFDEYFPDMNLAPDKFLADCVSEWKQLFRFCGGYRGRNKII